MLNPIFWLSLTAAFLALRWLADGWTSVAELSVRRGRYVPSKPTPITPEVKVAPAPAGAVRIDSSYDLDEAA